VTNFVLFRVERDRSAFLAALETRGVLMVPYANGSIRAVTHHGISGEDIDRVVAAAAEVLRETSPMRSTDPAAAAAG
jgi:threonine aldolase